MALVLDVRFTFLYHQFLHVLLCGGRIRHSICCRISQDLRLQGLRSLAHCVYNILQRLWPRILDMSGEINQDVECGPKPFATQDLGRLKGALTKWGYVGGKINFIICTYLMCIAPWKGFTILEYFRV